MKEPIGDLSTDILIVGSGPIAAVFARQLLDHTDQKILMVDVGDASSPVPGTHLKNVSYFQKNVDAFANIIRADFHKTSVPVNKRVEQTLGPNAYTVPYDTFEEGWGTKNENPEQEPHKNLSGAGSTYKIGGMGTHWTAACPKMHREELGDLLDMVQPEELEGLYKRAYELFDITQHAYDNSMRQNIILEALKDYQSKLDYEVEEGRGPQPLPLSVRRRVKNQAFLEWGSTATILGPHANRNTVHLGSAHTLDVNQVSKFRILEQHLCRQLVLLPRGDGRVIKHALVHNVLRDELVRIKAKKYIICCGTVLSAQLLHASGLGNGEEGDFLPALGRYLTEQPMAFCQVVMKRQLVHAIEDRYKDEVKQHKVIFDVSHIFFIFS